MADSHANKLLTQRGHGLNFATEMLINKFSRYVYWKLNPVLIEDVLPFFLKVLSVGTKCLQKLKTKERCLSMLSTSAYRRGSVSAD